MLPSDGILSDGRSRLSTDPGFNIGVSVLTLAAQRNLRMPVFLPSIFPMSQQMYGSHPNAIAHVPVPYGTPGVVQIRNALPNSDVLSAEQNHQNGTDNARDNGISLPKEENINNDNTIEDVGCT